MSTIYDVLHRPLITEKTNYLSTKLHQYAFEVAREATRSMVKDAIETIFKVTVLRVNIINVPSKHGRSARSRRAIIKSHEYKKAIVLLAADDRIPFFEGVE